MPCLAIFNLFHEHGLPAGIYAMLTSNFVSKIASPHSNVKQQFGVILLAVHATIKSDVNRYRIQKSPAKVFWSG
jgi:hypothetical protein